MGKGYVGFRVTNISKVTCAVQGYPTLRFFTGSLSSPVPLVAEVSHGGLVAPVSSPLARIVLAPVGSSASAALGAGLVVVGADFGQGRSPVCHEVTSILATPPGSMAGIRVALWYPGNFCNQPPGIEVSAFFAASKLVALVPPSLAPACTAADLAVTAGRFGAALSHVGGPLWFENISQLPCRMTGYPSVRVLGPAPGSTLIAMDTPVGYLGGLVSGSPASPVVTISPGARASALIEGVDAPLNGSEKPCPVYDQAEVVPPGVGASFDVALRWGVCADFLVHPVVPGLSGSR
jgi:hypothetical protein